MLADISIVIPVAPGDASWKSLLPTLGPALEVCEIWIVTPSELSLPKAYQRSNINVLCMGGGRATQLNAGAKVATRKYLWFIHSDTVLRAKNFVALEKSLASDPTALHYFELYFQNDGPLAMWITAVGVWFRCRLFALPFGDQGFCLARTLFFELGAFDTRAPYGEDHLLVWAARRRRIAVKSTGSFISTSARKYAQQGWLRVTGLHLKLTYLQANSERKRRKQENHAEGALAIFVKTPELSPVKTRLAEGIGKEGSLKIYSELVERMKNLAMEAEGLIPLTSYWAVAEEQGLSNARWSDLRQISQGEGSLGKRLSHVYAELLQRYRYVLLIGADSPTLDESILGKAVRALEVSPFVIGRATDGGFYLFGGKIPIQESIWTAVPYSADNTAIELVTRLSSLGVGAIAELPALSDLDTVADLRSFQKLGLFNGSNL